MLYTVTWLTVTEEIISGRSSPLIPTDNHLCVSALWIILVLKVCMLSRVDWSELLHKEQVTAKATYMTLLLEKQYFRGQSQQMACSFEVFLLKGENNEMIRNAFMRCKLRIIEKVTTYGEVDMEQGWSGFLCASLRYLPMNWR